MSPANWIALSGAVPEDQELKAHGWSSLGISYFVNRFVDRVIQAGGGIAMGSHPSFMPLILDVVRRSTHPTGPKLWKVWVGRRFIPDPIDQEKYNETYSDFADITWVGKPDPPGKHSDDELARLRQDALTDLRNQFIGASRALVCVGGRPTRKDAAGKITARAGVEEEAEIAWGFKLPIYLIGAGGGYALTVYRDHYEGKLNTNTNGLTDEQNQLIATHKDPFLAVSFVIEGLQRVKAL